MERSREINNWYFECKSVASLGWFLLGGELNIPNTVTQYLCTCVGRSGLERERAIVLSINRTADLSLIWIGGRGERRSFIWVTKIFKYDWLTYLNPALYVCILLIIVYVSHNIGRTFNRILYEYSICWIIIDVHITHNTL